jgi:hypothetical protein
MWVLWNLISIHLEAMLVLVQDMCIVCAKYNKGLEIILDALVVLLGDKAQVEA